MIAHVRAKVTLHDSGPISVEQSRSSAGLAALALIGSTLLLSQSTTALVIRFLVAVVACLLTLPQRKPLLPTARAQIAGLLAVIALVGGAFVVSLNEGTIDVGTFRKELLRLGYYGLLIFSTVRIAAAVEYLMLAAKATLLLHTAIQVTQLLFPQVINPIIGSFYVTDSTVHLDLAYYPLPNFRSGSIYLNPNVYVVFAVVAILIILEGRRRLLVKHSWIWLLIGSSSVFLTGSRMGLTALAIILALDILSGGSNAERRSLLPFMGAVGLIALWLSLAGLTPDARALDLEGGINDSFSIKWAFFVDRIVDMSPLYWLFGEGLSVSAGQQDMEIAHVLVRFGLMGFAAYCFLMAFLWRAARTQSRFFAYSTMSVLAVVAFGASTVMNLAVFPMLIWVLIPRWEFRNRRVSVNEG